MSKLEQKIHSTAIITDIRNFSQTFKKCQYSDSPDFLDFLELYYDTQHTIANILSDNFHMSLIGDGILAIFIGEQNHRYGYAYVLASHRILHKLCDNFVSEHIQDKISFGMGADCGNVWKLGNDDLNTYVGTVINRASRIESQTKIMSNTTTAVGNSLYKSLIKDFYPTVYDEMENYTTYDALLNDNPKSVLVSKHFMLQYVMDMSLKGVEKDAPIFRMSDSLINKDELFWGIMTKLIDEDKLKRIKELI
jgi:class 3 adenylate cyclase